MTALPSYVDPEAWAAFVEMRKAMKHPFTPRVQKMLVTKLMRLHADGYDANAILERSAIQGWRDFYPDAAMKRATEEKDPALQKIEQDRAKAVPMSAEVRQKLLQLRINQ